MASRGSITYNVARLVADLLSPLVGQNGYALKNSADLVKQLSELVLDESEVLISFDVTALFTCVPVTLSLQIIYDILCKDSTLDTRTKLTAEQIRDLLGFCLQTTYFQYDNKIY